MLVTTDHHCQMVDVWGPGGGCVLSQGGYADRRPPVALK